MLSSDEQQNPATEMPILDLLVQHARKHSKSPNQAAENKQKIRDLLNGALEETVKAMGQSSAKMPSAEDVPTQSVSPSNRLVFRYRKSR